MPVKMVSKLKVFEFSQDIRLLTFLKEWSELSCDPSGARLFTSLRVIHQLTQV